MTAERNSTMPFATRIRMALGKFNDDELAVEALVAELAATVSELRDALESLSSRKVAVPNWNVPENPWYVAVINACVINHINWYEDDARKSLHDLIDRENLVALDPVVSIPAAALIEQGRSKVVVPDGWKLVPVEPNWDMRNEGRELCIDHCDGSVEPERLAYVIYKAMLNAAPSDQSMLASKDEVK